VLITKLEVKFVADPIFSNPRKLLWTHAGNDSITTCSPYLDSLHRQVFNFKLTKENQDEFNRLVAETYSLIATLCETARGKPHIVFVYLRALIKKNRTCRQRALPSAKLMTASA
jgi:hypothetical protein